MGIDILTYQVESVQLFAKVGERPLHLFEIAQIATHPMDVCTRSFLTDLFDSLVSLFLLSVDHNHFGFRLGELPGDLESKLR